MKIGIVKAAPLWVAEFQRGCDALGYDHCLVDIHRNDWWSQLDGINALFWRTTLDDPAGLWQMRAKLPLIEESGILCYPSARMLWFYDNKVRETFFLQQLGVPIPETFISFDQEEALVFARAADYPLVVKTSGGASASGVALVRSIEEAERIINRIFKTRSPVDRLVNRVRQARMAKGNFLLARKIAQEQNPQRYVYFQEFTPSESDWRITTLGCEIISVFKRLNRPDDFRASGSGRFVLVDEDSLPLAACKLAMQISESQRFTSMTYDFLETQQGFLLSEFSFSFVLNKIYTETLFRQAGGQFRKIEPIPIGVMHLTSLLAGIIPLKPPGEHKWMRMPQPDNTVA